jgi:Type I phosphodiesterase / nucleotide pyrophosphatase
MPMPTQRIFAAALTLLFCATLMPASAQTPTPHNVVLFVPDGLRSVIVDPTTAPAMAAVRDRGVNFTNPHSLFPTFTTANASAMATGHYLGDTGDFSNTIYTGFPLEAAGGSVTPFLESDPVIDEVDDHFSGNYLDEEAILSAARAAGLSAATIGKLGPALIFDHTARNGQTTVVVDDATGSPAGVPLSRELTDLLAAAGLPAKAPGRGANGDPGSATKPGTSVANVEQQKYFADVATKVVLPMFKQHGKPFVLVFWSRDPDGTQHFQGDSLGKLIPGINGPTSLASIRDADDNLAQLQQALADLGLAATTDIIIAADHGFSTISKESSTSPAAKLDYSDVPHGQLPVGFLALDIGTALSLPVWDPDAKNARVEAGKHPLKGNGLIGANASSPEVVVAANGGADLVYLPQGDKALAAKLIEALLAQDYVSGLFVDDSLGTFPGTLPLSAINLYGAAVTPRPAIAVNFRSFDSGCGEPLRCTVEIADTGLQQGQGMHGSFSRADTANFMAAMGPDFKSGFADPAPVSNADIGKTIARILGVLPKNKGQLVGRVLEEAMSSGGAAPASVRETVVSEPGRDSLRTVLEIQRVGDTRYFDAAGFPGRSVGLSGAAAQQRAAGKP